MKKVIVAFIVVFALMLTGVGVNAAVLSTGLNNIAAEYEMTVNAPIGETVIFSADAFSAAVGGGDFESIRISALPDEGDGLLKFGDACACVGQVIKSEDMDMLRFEPCEQTDSSNFGFVYDSSYAMVCNMVFTKKNNTAPTAITSPEMTVFTSAVAGGQMRGSDSDGDSLRFEVVEYPSSGDLIINSKTGEFTFSAGETPTTDSFVFRVRDSLGAYSDETVFTLNIKENDSEYVFSDLTASNDAVAASLMTEKGLMTVRKSEGKVYFSPEEEVTRLDFLVACMNVFNADKIPTVENTQFADDSLIPDQYKGYVYSAAKLGIIGGVSENGELYFKPDSPITKAQASVMINNIVGYDPEKVSYMDGVPDWAHESVCAMYELGVYAMSDGETAALENLTKLDAAQMLYKVNCLVNE